MRGSLCVITNRIMHIELLVCMPWVDHCFLVEHYIKGTLVSVMHLGLLNCKQKTRYGFASNQIMQLKYNG